MIAHKHITKLVAALMALAVCLCFMAMAFAEQFVEASGGAGVTMEYESALFDTSQILRINIIMEEADWSDLLANAISEEYYRCDVEVNGEMFYSVGIRPKGNTSLTSIANDPTTDRYSFKLEFDQYVDGQTCYGLDKLVLNNNYADATNMKEALIYDMFQYLGADASLYNYAEISVNGEYWGVYLALEAVEDSFLLRNYGVNSGALYKPDSMNFGDMGGGAADSGGMAFDGQTPPASADGESPFPSLDPSQFGGETPEGAEPSQFRTPRQNETENGETENMPGMDGFALGNAGGMAGGSSTGSGGADLNYVGDDLDSYSTIWECEVTDTSEADQRRVVTALKNISAGTDLEKYMDIDNLLKYMAVHVFSVNADSLSGTMAHNYYLYEKNGQLNLLPWDYNLSFGGMGNGSDAASVVNSPIDDAFSGTNFFDTLMENEEYHAKYYEYLQRLVEEYLLGDGFAQFYARTRNQIDDLVASDPTAFYTYDEYIAAAETLSAVVNLRGQSIQGQLSGVIPSTESGQRDSDALVDASHIDLQAMGGMNTGGGGGMRFGDAGVGQDAGENKEVPSDASVSAAPQSTDAEANAPGIFLTSEAEGDSNAGEEAAQGTDGSQFGGQMPDGFGSGNPPENLDPSQFNGEMPGGFDSSQFPGEMPGQAQSDGENTNSDGQAPGSADVSNFQNRHTDAASAFPWDTAGIYGGCFAVLLAALIFAAFYKRKPRKR